MSRDKRFRLTIWWGALLSPICWARGHQWEQYYVLHVAWNSPGRFCKRCRRSETWRTEFETVDGVMKGYYVDKNGERVS